MWLAALGAISAVLLTLAAIPAQAHSELVSSSPTEGQALDGAPAQVELTFNEEISDAGLQVVAQGPQGAVSLGTPQLAGPKVTVPWPQTAPAGSYTLSYRVVSADGHPIDGSLAFSYGAGAAGSSASASASAGATGAAAPSGTSSFVDQGQAAADASASASAAAAASKDSSRSAFWPIVAVVAVGAAIGAGIAYALRARAARRS